MIKTYYPGKLFIMGEYAIMEPGNSAILVSVNRFLSASIIENDTLLVKSDYGIITDSQTDPKMHYVKEAIEVAKELLDFHKIALKPFKLDIESQLNDENNGKYGFGSSGVVITATLDAILKLHKLELSKLQLFKLAVLTQKRLNIFSSGGDLATTIYQGFIKYTRYTLESVKSDVSCIYETWDKLDIINLNLDYKVAVGYTGVSHDTNKALARFKIMKEKDSLTYNQLMKESQEIIHQALQEDFLEGLEAYRAWMLKLQSFLQYDIETETLTKLIDVALDLGYQAKVSGSGGGDCGIALMNKNENDEILKTQWEENGIQYIEGAVL